VKKLRVFQAAKDFHLSSDALMEVLRQLDIPVKSHMSTLEDEDIERVKSRFNAEKEAIRAEDQRKREKHLQAVKEREEREAERKAAAPLHTPAATAAGDVTTEVLPPPAVAPPVAPVAQPSGAPVPGQQTRGVPAGGRPQPSPASTFRPSPRHEARPNTSVAIAQNRPIMRTPQRPSAGTPPIMPLGASAQPLRSLGTVHAHGPSQRTRTKPGRHKKKSVDERLVKETVRKTVASLDSGRRGLRRHRRREEEGGPEVQEALKTIKVSEFITVAELASKMDVKPSEVLAACLGLGIPATINRRLDKVAIESIADDFGYSVDFVSEFGVDFVEEAPPTEAERLPRPPVVTIMGHVDHGKTSLLDYIRKSNVIAGEAGGITQHIGAYEVQLPSGQVTFLDTPGHEAFTAMRARGAQVTDIVVLVVAADDRVMPQTIEAIDHARAADVPIIVAINKIDVPGANPELVRTDLAARGLQPEEWGGKTIMVEISAKLGTNVDKLLEMILLQAEVLELKATQARRAKGAVIESRLHQGRGVVGTLLVQEGTLRVGDVFVAGAQWGKVRAMHNERGDRVMEAGPSTPVQVLGWSGPPTAGDTFTVVEDERVAREIATKRQQALREQEFRTYKHVTLGELYDRIKIGETTELNLILKADVDGSVEALNDALSKLSTDEVKLRIIHSAVGNISESDVLLAAASNAVIIGFHVRPDPKAHDLANREKVDIRQYQVIYEAVQEVKDAMSGLLKPEMKETVLGTAEVREIFRSSKIGTVAGCKVVAGTIQRNARARLVRKREIVWDGRLASLRRFKDDVREVENGFECGIALEGYQDIRVEDLIEAYQIEEIARKLE
jgi:translation initiation factor IF-2